MKNTALMFASVLLGLAMAWPAASQNLARVLSVFPNTAEVSVKRLGSGTAEPLAPDTLLQRWDRVETSEEGSRNNVVLVQNWFEELKRRVPTD